MKTYIVEVSYFGTKRWYLNEKLHCEHGPAVEWADGSKEYWLNDQRHRTDGPAVELANGIKYWYLHGVEYSEAEWRNQLQKVKTSCVGKVVEVDGVKYKLVEA